MCDRISLRNGRANSTTISCQNHQLLEEEVFHNGRHTFPQKRLVLECFQHVPSILEIMIRLHLYDLYKAKDGPSRSQIERMRNLFREGVWYQKKRRPERHRSFRTMYNFNLVDFSIAGKILKRAVNTTTHHTQGKWLYLEKRVFSNVPWKIYSLGVNKTYNLRTRQTTYFVDRDASMAPSLLFVMYYNTLSRIEVTKFKLRDHLQFTFASCTTSRKASTGDHNFIYHPYIFTRRSNIYLAFRDGLLQFSFHLIDVFRTKRSLSCTALTLTTFCRAWRRSFLRSFPKTYQQEPNMTGVCLLTSTSSTPMLNLIRHGLELGSVCRRCSTSDSTPPRLVAGCGHWKKMKMTTTTFHLRRRIPRGAESAPHTLVWQTNAQQKVYHIIANSQNGETYKDGEGGIPAPFHLFTGFKTSGVFNL